LSSVLRYRDFVQMPGVDQNKFKLSVAGGLHLPPKGPKLEQGNVRRGAVAAQNGHLPLTAAYVAGFINS
jgi:hypothetical protein